MALTWESDAAGDLYACVGHFGPIRLYVDMWPDGTFGWMIKGGSGGTAPTREAAQRAAEDAARQLLRAWLQELGETS